VCEANEHGGSPTSQPTFGFLKLLGQLGKVATTHILEFTPYEEIPDTFEVGGASLTR
jgi:hypothetical protein